MSAVSINVNGGLLAALEIHPDRFSWGHIYKGTETELVAAGLVRSEWLPGRGNNFKVRQRVVVSHDGSARLIRTRHGGRYEPAEGESLLAITTAGKSRFEVWKELCPSEQKRREEEQRPRLELERVEMFMRAAEQAREVREREPRNPQPWDPTAFRSELVMMLKINEALVMRPARGESCFGSRDIPAHKLCDEDLTRVRQKLAEAEMIIENSKVEPINHAATRRPALTLVRG